MLATAAPTIVREATKADLLRVVAVLCAANAEFAPVLPAAFYRAYLANVLDVHSRMQESHLLVAEHHGRIAGTIAHYPDASREGWGWPSHWSGIRAVAVAPSARGLSIGRQLAQECIARSRMLGAEAVCLHTASFMSAAVAMYEGLGSSAGRSSTATWTCSSRSLPKGRASWPSPTRTICSAVWPRTGANPPKSCPQFDQ